ncbi:MAG: sigma factor [Chloroflexia bacterium]
MASTTVSGEPDPESEEAQRDSPEQLLLLANLKLVLARLPEDEQRLIGSMIPKKGDQFSRTPPEGRRRFSLSPEEDQRFKRAWEPFLRTYQKRVERLARKVSPNDWEDLYAVGALALLHAAWKYEDTGKSFWSYAHVIVSRAMFSRRAHSTNTTARLPRAYSQVRKARGENSSSVGNRTISRRSRKSPTAAEIARHIEVNLETR